MQLSHTIATTKTLKKIGHITPSCNSAIEHVTPLAALSLADRVSNHYARLPVETIALSDDARGQFEPDLMLRTARTLADAAMDVVLWNGTSACWNGTASDHEICDLITRETGIPASTSILAQYEVFELSGTRRFGLAVPYTDDVAAATIDTFGGEGYEAVSHANLGLSVGRDMAYVPLEEIKDLIRAADSPDAECLIVICTGLPAAFVVDELEQELGKPIYDSILVTLWKGLQAVGVTDPVDGWGSLLAGAAVRPAASAQAT